MKKKQREALERLKASDEVTIGSKEASEVLGVHQMTISYMGINGTLPFPAFMSGNRVKISRIGFLKWGGWYEEDIQSR